MFALIVGFYLFTSTAFKNITLYNYIAEPDRFRRNCHIYAINTAMEKRP